MEVESYRAEHIAVKPAAAGPSTWAKKGLPKDVSVEAARKLLPSAPGVRLWYEPQTDRIRVANFFEGMRYTKSWPTSLGIRECILECLKWVWGEHTACTGTPCPYAWLS